MAFVLQQHVSAESTNTNSVTTVQKDFTQCNLIIAHVSTYASSTAGTFADSSGNTWSPLTAQSVSDIRGQLFYCYAPTVTSTQTFSNTNGGLSNYPSIYVLGFSGSATSPFDQQNGGTSGSSPVSSGNVTPGAANELVVTGFSPNEAFTSLAVSSFTLSEQQAYSPGLAFGGGIAYQIQTSATTVSASWTFSTSTITGVVATIATFQAAAGVVTGTIEWVSPSPANQIPGNTILTV